MTNQCRGESLRTQCEIKGTTVTDSSNKYRTTISYGGWFSVLLGEVHLVLTPVSEPSLGTAKAGAGSFLVD